MRDSSSTAALFLPFGSLTGVIPVDAVRPDRTLGDFSKVLASKRMSELQQQIHSLIDPVPSAPRRRTVDEKAGDSGA